MPAAYLIADVEESTPRWERDARAMRLAMKRTAALVEDAVMRHGGRIYQAVADEVFILFEGGDPLACALEIQRAMQGERFDDVGGLALRLGVHAGPVELGGAPDPVSANRASRIAACAWGGQIVVSGEALEAFALPPGAWVEDFGAVRLRGVFSPVRLYGLLCDGLRQSVFPPPRVNALEAPALPAASGPLIGREAELNEAIHAVSERGVRHLTIVGPPGNGKSRLLLEAAQALSEERTAVFVALDPASRPDNLQAALLRALSLPALIGVPSDKQLLEFLRDKRALLVVDNAEAGALDDGFLDRLLDLCPGVVVLAAGRAPMGGGHEDLLPLSGLRCESGDVQAVARSPAFAYFAHELRRIGGALELDEASAALFKSITGKVSGSPLALRLAARWARVVPLAEIAGKLAASVDFLSSTLQSHEGYDGLRALFAASWDLLSPDRQRLLACLSVIHGSFDYQDAQSICDCELAALTDLELRGLVERHGERLSLHPLIKEYARERLGLSAEDARQSALRHSRRYLAMISSASGEARVSIINNAYADLRAAWMFAVGQEDAGVAWPAAEPLFYALAAGFKFQEAAELFSLPAANAALSMRSMAFKANSLVQLGALAEGRSLADAVLSLAGEPLSLAHADQALGNIDHIEGNYEAAFNHYERARAHREREADLTGLAYSQLALAVLAVARADSRTAHANLERAHNAIHAANAHELVQAARLTAADLAALEGRAEEADAILNEALALAPASAQQTCRALLRHAAALSRREDLKAARGRLTEAAAIAETSGDLRGRSMALLELGRLEIKAGALVQAKASLLRACREALRLGAAPLLRQTLLALADAERTLGNESEAKRLGQALAAASSRTASELKQTTEDVMLAAEREGLGLGRYPEAG